MSARSMIRARRRRQARATRDGRRRRAGAGVAAVLGVAAAVAPSAGAADFQVTNLGDASPPAPCDATCNLREAVTAANQDAAADTITFAPALSGQIVLTFGQIPINAALTIDGPGAEKLSISGDANGDDVPNAPDSRILTANTDVVGQPNEPVTISGLTLTEGMAAGGGAINSSYAALTLDEVRVTDNRSSTSGGGVFSRYGPLTITDSDFSSNTAPAGGGDGGAVLLPESPGAGDDSDLVIRESTFSGNSAGADGGAVFFGYGSDTALIERSTFNGNQAGGIGGGIYLEGPDVAQGPVTIQNSTVSGNTSGNDGGGIGVYNYGDGQITIQNSTISGNGAVDRGGGIFRSGLEITTPGTDNVTLSSTIVASNTAGIGPDLGDGPAATGAFRGGFNLVGNPSGASILSTAGPNLLGIDPQLSTLADNGGPTKTMVPATTSAAIDQGTANGLSGDQRGEPRTTLEPVIADAEGGDATDIGAVEVGDSELSRGKVKAKGKQKQRGREIGVKLTAKAAEPIKVAAKGKVKVGRKSFVLQKFSTLTAANRTARITLNPKVGRANRKINKVLDRRKKVVATLKVTLTDDFGNSETERPKVRLK